MEALHGPVSRDNVLNGACQHMAIMGKTSRKGRAIVKGVEWFALAQLKLSLEGLDLGPEFQDLLLGFWKVNTHGDCGSDF